MEMTIESIRKYLEWIPSHMQGTDTKRLVFLMDLVQKQGEEIDEQKFYFNQLQELHNEACAERWRLEQLADKQAEDWAGVSI